MKETKTTIDLKMGDCLQILSSMDKDIVDLIYMDPPFFTQKIQRLKNKDRTKEFHFDDKWNCHKDYAFFLHQRILMMHRVLKDSGSIFVHCDRNAVHIIRTILDEIFSKENFRSEIIWFYKRWSNSKKGLLSSHQTILFYSKSKNYRFNVIYQGYSESTNVDQILQKRARDKDGKSVYSKSNNGKIESNGPKKGVPLGDVWDIPLLNPKANERVGYPTQKPVLLLERIIKVASDKNCLVLDPFCGSGTTLIAAAKLERRSIGIDVSEEAIKLTKERLKNPIITKSGLLEYGRESYLSADKNALAVLSGLDYVPVHRNSGIDAFLRKNILGKPAPIRIQREYETVMEAAIKLNKAIKNKDIKKGILVKIDSNTLIDDRDQLPKNIIIVNSTAHTIENILSSLLE